MNIENVISKEEKAGKSYLSVDIQTELDEIALRTILFSKPNFVPPSNFEEVDGKQSFNYDVSANGFIPLNSYTSMESLDFLELMSNLTTALVQSYDYFLNPQNLLIIEDYIFVNPHTKEVRVVYVPTLSEILTIDELNKKVFALSRALSKNPNSKEWQDVVLGLWDMTDATTIYEARDKYSKLYRNFRNKSKSEQLKKNSEIAPREMNLPSEIFEMGAVIKETVDKKTSKLLLKQSKKDAKLVRKLSSEQDKKHKKDKKSTKKSSSLFKAKPKATKNKKAKDEPVFGTSPFVANTATTSADNLNNRIFKDTFTQSGDKTSDISRDFNYEVASTTENIESVVNFGQNVIEKQNIVKHIVDDNLTITVLTIGNKKHYMAEHSNGDTFINGKKSN